MNSGHIISFVLFFLHCQHLIYLRILIYYVICVKYICQFVWRGRETLGNELSITSVAIRQRRAAEGTDARESIIPSVEVYISNNFVECDPPIST